MCARFGANGWSFVLHYIYIYPSIYLLVFAIVDFGTSRVANLQGLGKEKKIEFLPYNGFCDIVQYFTVQETKRNYCNGNTNVPPCQHGYASFVSFSFSAANSFAILRSCAWVSTLPVFYKKSPDSLCMERSGFQSESAVRTCRK
jgi:hypothetical protein